LVKSQRRTEYFIREIKTTLPDLFCRIRTMVGRMFVLNNDSMKNSQSTKDGKPPDGIYKEYFKNGAVSCEGNYKNGERTGQWKYWLANGQLKATGKYTKGKMTGKWTWYRENGKLMQTGSFTNEIKTGTWTRYKADGSLLDKTEFANGKKKANTK
jgi:antitoxin component YwqK of YwqJK toxin-antitoxin module